ncbi:restriction endonuclease [Lysobacter enzymogenes]|uniref:Restriction endonuclease n=1 Tax=Lysobacter enzymogenes TaxID=69 RepID=A0A3N2REK6_LYSEN|nr:restriction endonuclease [Lysobacter enzymogenes]ROU05871.1 restriction endonuclease [Lysobacter enzymogenes]
MSSFSLWAAAAVALTVGLGSTAYLWSYRRHRTEVATGIAGLAKMRWREFARLIVEALRERGFEAESVEESLARGTQAELRLVRAGKPWLLSCKLGDGDYKVPAATVAELADAVRFHGAAGGLLVTTGRFDANSERVADGLDLYSGESLWELVEPQLPASTRHEIIAAAQKRSIQTIVGAWGAAIALALIAGFAVPALLPAPAPATDSAPRGDEAAANDSSKDQTGDGTAAAPAATPPATAPVPAPHAAAPVPSASSGDADADRAEVIRTVGALSGTERAAWSTASNLLIYRHTDAQKPDVDAICQVLERYPELRSSRVQLQPPPGSDSRVRFFQCKAY